MKLPGIKYSENLNLLLVSFAIAVIFWVFVKSSRSEEGQIDVPVIVELNDPRIETRITPERIPVRFRYPRELQSYISSRNFHFRVDTDDLRQDLDVDWKTKTQVLTERNWVANVPQARRIRLIKIGHESKMVEVKMRWRAQQAIVQPDLVGVDKLPQGTQLVTPVRISPSDVWVVATDEVLATTPRDDRTSRIRIMTEPINVSDAEKTVWKKVALRLPSQIELVDPHSNKVEVNLEIQEVQTIREIRGVKLDFKALAPEAVDLEYKEKSATVTVFGPHTLLKELTPESFDITMIRPPEELPGTTREVLLEAHFAQSISPAVRQSVTVKSIDPKMIKIKYVQRRLPTPGTQP